MGRNPHPLFSAEQLLPVAPNVLRTFRRLQQKFGQQQAKLRNMESLAPGASGYGTASQSWKKKPGSTVSSPAKASAAAAPAKRPKGPEDPLLKEARKRAAEKLVQLIIAEDDTVLMLQEVTERLFHQQDVVTRLAKSGASHADYEINKQAERQLESEQSMLSVQLEDLRRVRGELEQKLNEQHGTTGSRKLKGAAKVSRQASAWRRESSPGGCSWCCRSSRTV